MTNRTYGKGHVAARLSVPNCCWAPSLSTHTVKAVAASADTEAACWSRDLLPGLLVLYVLCKAVQLAGVEKSVAWAALV